MREMDGGGEKGGWWTEVNCERDGWWTEASCERGGWWTGLDYSLECPNNFMCRHNTIPDL